MDAITLLKKDHQLVKKLFRDFERLHHKSEEGVTKQMEAIVTRLIRELSVHAAIEEELVYPLAKARIRNAEDNVYEALEEHHHAKLGLTDIQRATRNERFPAKVMVLAELVKHHIEEEETVLLPKLRKALGRDELKRLGEMITRVKKAVPTRPHPRSPDTPPLNYFANAGAAVLDKARDAVRDMLT